MKITGYSVEYLRGSGWRIFYYELEKRDNIPLWKWHHIDIAWRNYWNQKTNIKDELINAIKTAGYFYIETDESKGLNSLLPFKPESLE